MLIELQIRQGEILDIADIVIGVPYWKLVFLILGMGYAVCKRVSRQRR
jgi:hypothetical protein